MPIYEYECSACGARREVLQKMNDEPLKECPACHAPALKKLLSAAAFRLSGSGWYETDFKKDNRRNVLEPSSAEPSADKAKPAESGASDKSSPSDKPSPSGKSSQAADAGGQKSSAISPGKKGHTAS